MKYCILNQRKKGFTLIELLVVIVILGALVSIATGAYASSGRRGRDNRRKSDLKSIAIALEVYYNDKGKYPTGLNGIMMGCGDSDASSCAWGGQFKDKNNTVYMVVTPSDPFASQTYYYVSTGASYKLYAHLENTLDTGTGVNQAGYSSLVGNKCGISAVIDCTYGIASSNTTP